MNVKLYFLEKSKVLIPLFGEAIHAGFESPATDYEESRIDLNSYLTKYPEATFYARVTGDCMTGSGIFDGDLLVVDRSLKPRNGDVVVGVMDGEFILRVFFKTGDQVYLMPDNPRYHPIAITAESHFEIWGVVPHTILNQASQRHVRLNRLQQLLR